MIKNIITSAVVALVVAIAVIGLVGGNSAKLGGTTNYDSLGLSGTLDVTGAATVASLVASGRVTSGSTAQAGKASVAGCLILGDSAAGASPVYITATGATVTASTTKPAACATAL